MERLIEHIETHIPVSPELRADLTGAFRKKELEKNDLLIWEGQYNVPLAFIHSGILRCFNLKNSKDITNDFFFENTFVTDFAGLMQNLPAKQNFGAVEKTALLILSRDQLFNLTARHPELKEWGSKMAESLFTQTLVKQAIFKSDSPEERYRAILREKPEIIRRIPLSLIASYLGITQVHLSRIRNKIR